MKFPEQYPILQSIAKHELGALQGLHVAPFMPQALTEVPGWQVLDESTQPAHKP